MMCQQAGSLSARRAWIEIDVSSKIWYCGTVALRKESVDRNPVAVGSLITLGGSLSARRAWIEILFCVGFCLGAKGRSPQGERG